MADVVLRNGESQEALLRRFRKKIQRSGVLRDARRKRWFVSKSEQRRIAKRKAIRRHRRRQWRKNNRHRR
jgi:small subunit ribosomal protein S21